MRIVVMLNNINEIIVYLEGYNKQKYKQNYREKVLIVLR